VIASDYDRTAAILHCMAAALGIPCTFSDGLPIGVTRAGRAAHAYVEWVASGYRLDPLLAALRQGVIRLHDGGTGGGSAAPQGRTADDADPAAPSAVIRELERSGIGWGRERYALLAKLADRAEAGPGAAADRAAVLRLLQRVFARLFELLPEEAPAQPERFMRAVVDFVRTYAVVEGDGDVQVIAQLQELERSFKMASGIRMSGSLAVRYVREALDGLRVHVSAVPAPGRLHVASLEQGGQSGRPHTFILGMSEERWTASMRQDPVLLDEERARIGAELATSAARSRRRRQERNSRLGMIRGSCTVSCVTAALTDGQERMPAFEMLQLYRRKTGRADADFAELLRAMGDAVRYFRGMPGGGSAIGDRSGRLSGAALDAVDAWLQRLLSDGGQVKAGQDAVFERYPSLGDGHRAIQARMDINLSPYDGLVETDRHPLPLPGMSGDPAAAFSASRLEQYAGCPLQFFYQEVLGVRVKDAAEFDRSRWLDARRRGSLLHEIFNLYLIEMRDRRKHAHEPLPHDEERLQAIAEEAIRRFAEEVPAPSAHIFEKEADGIRRDVRMFAQSERQRTSVPVFTELPLHEDGEPFRLELGEELTLPIRGFVDRVDEIAPHKYKIYDYKTGNPRRYQPNETFAAGTQLQLPLYGAAVEQWMRRTGYDPEARVVASAYYFPTERGMGEEVARPQDRREDMAALLRTMLEAMAQGLYPPTAEAKNCLWCDYSAVCGSQAEQFAAKREAAGEGGRLGPIMEVSRYD
jgi:RecB family exonuclease